MRNWIQNLKCLIYPCFLNINNVLCVLFFYDISFWLFAFCMPTISKLHPLINDGYKMLNIFSTLSCLYSVHFLWTFLERFDIAFISSSLLSDLLFNFGFCVLKEYVLIIISIAQKREGEGKKKKEKMEKKPYILPYVVQPA